MAAPDEQEIRVQQIQQVSRGFAAIAS